MEGITKDNIDKFNKMKDLIMLKVILDIKIKIFSEIESPKYKELTLEILPLAITLHKSMNRPISTHMS